MVHPIRKNKQIFSPRTLWIIGAASSLLNDGQRSGGEEAGPWRAAILIHWPVVWESKS